MAHVFALIAFQNSFYLNECTTLAEVVHGWCMHSGDYWQWKVQTILMSPLDNSVEGNKGGSTSEPTTHAPTLGHLSWMYAYVEVETGLYIMWKRV